MTLRSVIFILAIVFCTTACSKHLRQGKGANALHYDTTTIAIIPFNPRDKYLFDTTYKAATLTQKDLEDIDSLFNACITWYNNEVDDNHKSWRINLNERHYRKQLIAVINKNGEKEVWVNCLCQEHDNWKHEIPGVMDGGTCYINFKINLATKHFYHFGVNGLA